MDELLWAGADAQARALRDGWVTAPELAAAVLRRAEQLNPALNAFRVLYPVLEAAEAAQRRLDAGERTPLLGVPVAVKDDSDVAGDVTAQGGRPQFPPATRDSAAVARLRAAGAVIVGHTLTPERCLWPVTESLTFGATRNPWHLDHTPGGSSGGSAAAVAAGIVGAATGSDGGGSIRVPAAAAGVFGLKTTRGLVPMAPRVEGWHGLSSIGALGRRVADAAALLDVLTEGGGYRRAIDTDPGPLRIALAWRTPLGTPRLHPTTRRAVLDTADRLRALGHTVVEADPPLGARPTPQFIIRYLRGVADDVRALPNPEWLEPRTRKIVAVGRLVPDRALRWARAAEAGLHARMAPFLTEFDAILQPTWLRTPPTIGTFHGSGIITTWAGVSARIPYFPTWNVLGYPVATLPVGRDDLGLPIGVQLIGPTNSERLLLSASGQYERAHPWTDKKPTM
ncbi:amidase family protein [Actinokineospora sp. NBRC 105648]|uniref:amidase family protein n=1 Tax=Actinokineospora sp. NBRC 105648 TaxID=3032206 RepID=UPI0024A4C15A|nr:amidase family protein [Actinokineospora sp. NBRC 105648]GLZ38603.1 putative amidase AmiB2 [Actinokineospora sp. NBRC 105648]